MVDLLRKIKNLSDFLRLASLALISMSRKKKSIKLMKLKRYNFFLFITDLLVSFFNTDKIPGIAFSCAFSRNQSEIGND